MKVFFERFRYKLSFQISVLIFIDVLHLTKFSFLIFSLHLIMRALQFMEIVMNEMNDRCVNFKRLSSTENRLLLTELDINRVKF